MNVPRASSTGSAGAGEAVSSEPVGSAVAVAVGIASDTVLS
jgi:hypothetical protein